MLAYFSIFFLPLAAGTAYLARIAPPLSRGGSLLKYLILSAAVWIAASIAYIGLMEIFDPSNAVKYIQIAFGAYLLPFILSVALYPLGKRLTGSSLLGFALSLSTVSTLFTPLLLLQGILFLQAIR